MAYKAAVIETQLSGLSELLGTYKIFSDTTMVQLFNSLGAFLYPGYEFSF